MSNGNIRAIGPEAAPPASISSEHSDAAGQAAPPGDAFASDPIEFTDYEPIEPERGSSAWREWIVPVLALIAIAGWTALYAFALRDELIKASFAAPRMWIGWVTQWAVPVLLICVVWLLAARNSRAEAKRFGSTAALLSHESRQLEDRLSVVNRELSLAREFLGAQSRELDSLGRVASERISAHATELQDLIRDNGAQVEAIGEASETALGNMRRLRDDLPVLAGSARDVTNQIGNAGHTAQEQLDGLVAGFEQLGSRGADTDRQIAALSERVDAALGGFEAGLARIDRFVTARYDQLEEKTATYREEIDAAERQGIAALNQHVELLQAETKAIAATLQQAETNAMSQLEASKDRFHDEISKMVESLDKLDRDAMAAAQRRVEELHVEATRFDDRLEARDKRFLGEMARRQDDFDTREAQATQLLSQRLSDLDEALAQRRDAQIAQTEQLVAQSSAMGGELDRLTALIGQIDAQTGETRTVLSDGLGALGNDLSDKRAALEQTRTQLADLTEAGVRLLEIIQSGARHSREDLAGAIASAMTGLDTVEQRTGDLSAMMLTARNTADGLGDYLVETTQQIDRTDSSLGAMHDRLTRQSDDALARLTGLQSGFADLTTRSNTFADETQDRIREALAALEQATGETLDALDTGARERIDALAASLSHDAVERLDEALREGSADSIAQLDEAAARVSDAGREATVHLRDQLARINELTLNLEQRIAQARERARDEVGNDFARRMALITDSLNSNAIDIASALSSEVSDTAWDQYLKGDRSIFTRRAVRLIDRGQARAIAELHEQDKSFRTSVDRYIHDFEAMLRTVLSTRDGNALAVTMLGADAGKLYVVLAQAIERLRT